MQEVILVKFVHEVPDKEVADPHDRRDNRYVDSRGCRD
jgi:hypothetical protein